MLPRYSALWTCRQTSPRPYSGPSNKFWDAMTEAGIATTAAAKVCSLCITPHYASILSTSAVLLRSMRIVSRLQIIRVQLC